MGGGLEDSFNRLDSGLEAKEEKVHFQALESTFHYITLHLHPGSIRRSHVYQIQFKTGTTVTDRVTKF